MVLSLPSRGAWIEILLNAVASLTARSLPSRGAWIEISFFKQYIRLSVVAPLAGSVDRNFHDQAFDSLFVPSLPSRGAWIEMIWTRWGALMLICRSPRGERG